MANQIKILQISIVIGNLTQALGQIGAIKNSFRLLGSTLAAVFRTTIIAVFFATIRQAIINVQNTANAIRDLASQFAELNFIATRAAVAMSDGAVETGVNFLKISEYARSMSNQVMYSSKQILNGMTLAAIAGYGVSDSMILTEKSAKLASMEGENLETVMNGVISTATTFGLSVKNIAPSIDVMTQAVLSSKLELTGFFNALNYSAPSAVAIFGETKDTFIDTSAALMTLAQRGQSASRGGTALRSVFQRLASPTERLTTAFAKYGINLYEGGTASSKLFSILGQGQGTLSKYYDKLDKAKQKQLALAAGNKTNTEEFKKVTKEVNDLESSMGVLEKGLDDVYGQFTMAGGKMKAFHTILNQISSKVPIEAIQKLFGVRGGTGATALIEGIKDFNKFREELNKVYKDSEEGSSLVEAKFELMTATVQVAGERIKNIFSNIWYTIFDPASEAFKPIMITVIGGLTKIQKFFEANKDKIKLIFKDTFANLDTTLKELFPKIQAIVEKIFDVFSNKSYTLPIYEYSKKTGITSKDEGFSGDSFGSKIGNIMKSVFSLLLSYLKQTIEASKSIFEAIGVFIGQALIAQIELNKALFIGVGKYIAQGLIEAATILFKEHPIVSTTAILGGLTFLFGSIIIFFVELKAALASLGLSIAGAKVGATAVAAGAGAVANGGGIAAGVAGGGMLAASGVGALVAGTGALITSWIVQDIKSSILGHHVNWGDTFQSLFTGESNDNIATTTLLGKGSSKMKEINSQIKLDNALNKYIVESEKKDNLVVETLNKAVEKTMNINGKLIKIHQKTNSSR